ncbi:hypothetical protein [Moorena sp. SIO3H5]|uniref:hypothetical protein n=1 Tax=Moorena sp. SIO3H5 TaxID=2607834 RepID=UPI0013B9D7AD|nr:hypothetical protein [Moorena sp. SIO3H5]NEO74686.1 hypothetical protein [Moorena sp. SIO3H5]
MLKRLIQWIKNFFQRLFGKQQKSSQIEGNIQSPPPLSDTDLELLFTELLEGVHQAKGQAWALKWLKNLEHRVPEERWLQWLEGFGERLMAVSTPNNELASRMVELGDLEVGDVGDYAHDIGMDLLTRNQKEPIFEYEGPDATPSPFATDSPNASDFTLGQESVFTQQPESVFTGDMSSHPDISSHPIIATGEDEDDNLPEGEYQTVSLDELFSMLQQDQNLCEQIAQQLGIKTEDPEAIIQELINQFNQENQSKTNE